MSQRFTSLLRSVVLVAVSIALVLGLSSSASADTIYTYTGNPFTEGDVFFVVLKKYVSGTFTLASPLAPNQTDINPVVLSWSLSDGDKVFSSSDKDKLESFTLSTDSRARVTFWDVVAEQTTIIVDWQLFIATSNPPPPHAAWDSTTCSPSPCEIAGGIQPEAFNSGMPGVWAIVPEPGASTLLATGVLALSCVRRRVPRWSADSGTRGG